MSQSYILSLDGICGVCRGLRGITVATIETVQSSDFVNINDKYRCDGRLQVQVWSGPEIKIRSERDRESTSEAVKQPTQARPGQAELALQPAQSAS